MQAPSLVMDSDQDVLRKAKMNNEACSEVFQDAMCDAGGLTKTCQLCGRIHYNSLNTGDYEEGEFDELLKKAYKEPSKYIAYSGGISYGWVMGFQVVFGCPCGWQKFISIETFLVEHREQVSRFYKKMAEAAAQQAKELDRISKSI